ncbi:hypothetical protein [Kitasatospora sp. NPDC058190]|uniref:hypothetical protein n=1 Tax=Kitasatospora sp. NPDC058190 TaxID=3346371 RepID=UPI0036DA8540
MTKSRNKKQKRPLAAGASRPAKPVRKRTGKDAPLAPRTVRRTAVLVGVLAPLLIIGLLALATNPDHQVACTVLAVLVLMASVVGLMLIRSTGWVVWPAVLLGVLLLVLPTSAIRAQLIAQRGVETRVVVTAVHSGKDKMGKVSWTCDIRREDHQPLPHGTIGGTGCSGGSVGTTATVLVDPAGWAPPATRDEDLSFRGSGVYVTGVVAVLWAALTFGAAHRALRGKGTRGGRGGRKGGR